MSKPSARFTQAEIARVMRVAKLSRGSVVKMLPNGATNQLPNLEKRATKTSS